MPKQSIISVLWFRARGRVRAGSSVQRVASPRNGFTAVPQVARGNRQAEAGFTLMETLIALVVFAIAVVGLVAMESRSLEAQRASNELRAAERIAQEEMAELMTRGIGDLVEFHFDGTAAPNFPYDDTGLDAADRVRSYRRPPADIPSTTSVVGSVPDQFLVIRRVDKLPDDGTQPLGNPDDVQALVFTVSVLWLDTTNPSLPPPATATVTGLDETDIDPAAADYKPYVGSLVLRTVRANDQMSAVAP